MKMEWELFFQIVLLMCLAAFLVAFIKSVKKG